MASGRRHWTARLGRIRGRATTRPLRRSERRELRKLAARELRDATGEPLREWRVSGNILACWRGGERVKRFVSVNWDTLNLTVLTRTQKHGHILGIEAAA